MEGVKAMNWNAGIYGKQFSCRFNPMWEGTIEEQMVQVNKQWREWRQLEPIRRIDKYSLNYKDGAKRIIGKDWDC
jgi:hypothetical protein